MRILYELTYMFRGHSGVPKDTLHQAQILEDFFPAEFEMATNPNSFLSISKFRLDNWFGNNKNIDRIFRVSPRKRFLPRMIENAAVVGGTFLNIRPRGLVVLNKKFQNHLPEVVRRLMDSRIRSIYVIPLNFKSRYVMNILGIPARIRTFGFDIFVQQSLLPLRVSKGTTHVIRLHDLLPITHPQFFTSGAAFLYRRSIALAVKEKEVVWVWSAKATEQQFKAMYGNHMKTFVAACPIDTNYTGDFVEKVKEVLILATVEPRKNIDLAVDGFLLAQQNGHIGKDWTLVVAGSYGWKAQKLYEDLQNGAYGPTVIYKEGPSDVEVISLLERSSVILCTSSHEGFSRPPLEGMAYGAIPVVTNIPQHRETIGEKGYFIEGEGIDAISKAISAAVRVSETDCKELRNELRQHVMTNFSRAVVGQQWKNVFDNISLASKRP